MIAPQTSQKSIICNLLTDNFQIPVSKQREMFWYSRFRRQKTATQRSPNGEAVFLFPLDLDQVKRPGLKNKNAVTMKSSRAFLSCITYTTSFNNWLHKRWTFITGRTLNTFLRVNRFKKHAKYAIVSWFSITLVGTHLQFRMIDDRSSPKGTRQEISFTVNY